VREYGSLDFDSPEQKDIATHVYPELAMKVARWGNSLAVRLPAAVVEVLQLREGDEIEIRVDDPRSLSVAKKPDIGEMLKALRQFRGRLPKDFKFDREELHERG
jgi:antitoxin MazE